ncbi:MAG: glycosyltransferase, partial [Anaerolineales bacterium]
MSHTVSIVIPVLNGEEVIADLLRALTSQRGLSNDPEIIVVDNGSVDRTREIVRQFGVVLLDEKKGGPGPARNCGLSYASGDIIAHLDADTIPTRRWLSELVAPFVDPDVTLAAGKSLVFQPETLAQRFMAGYDLYDAWSVSQREIFPFAPSLNLAVRREAAVEVGGWAEDMPTGEDIDFCHRVLAKFPSKIVYQSGAVLFHRTRSSIEALRKTAWTYGEGLAHIYRKYPDEIQLAPGDYLQIIYVMTYRSLLPYFRRFLELFGSSQKQEIEFAYTQRFWTWWHWRGFFSMYRSGHRREIP